MPVPKNYLILIWLCIFFLVFPLGCAQTAKQIPKYELGSVGVVHGNFTPKVILDKPARGWLAGAGRGSANWAGKAFAAPFSGGGGRCSGDGCGIAALIILALAVTAATVGGIAGGVAGAVKAEPAKKVDEAESIINEAIAKLKIQETFRDHFVKEAQEKTRGRFTVLEGYGPASIDQKATYGHLANRGIDTIVQISVIRFGLTGKWEINPLLSLEMDVQVKVIQVRDEKELFSEIFHYTGGQQLFSEWCVDNARPLNDEFDLCYRSFSDKIITALFFGSDLESS